MDELDELLGRVPMTEASPWFADRVVRSVDGVRREEGRRGWLRWALPVGLASTLVVLTLVGMESGGSREARVAMAAPSVEFETIQDLDLIVTTNETTLWLENSPL